MVQTGICTSHLLPCMTLTELDLHCADCASTVMKGHAPRDPETAAFKCANLRHGSIGVSHRQQAFYWHTAAKLSARSGSGVKICEVGFNAGHSTALWMFANPSATVETFDIFDNDTQRPMVRNLNLLQARFPDRIRAHVGSSLSTIPRIPIIEPHCDLVHVMGGIRTRMS